MYLDMGNPKDVFGKPTTPMMMSQLSMKPHGNGSQNQLQGQLTENDIYHQSFEKSEMAFYSK